MFKLTTALIVIAVTTQLSACGQKGPLFIPVDPSASQATTAETGQTLSAEQMTDKTKKKPAE